MICVYDRIENIVGKRENSGNRYFQQVSVSELFILEIVLERVKRHLCHL